MNVHLGASNKAIKKAIKDALAHQEAGRLKDAEFLFWSVLQSEPHHPVANHGLGILSVKQGNAKAAIPFLNAALNANLQEHRYWFSLVEALIEAGATGDARSVLEKGVALGLSGPSLSALSLRLKHWELYHLAVQHHQAGRLAEAEQGYTEILTNDPAHADSFHMLGVLATQTGRFEVAVAFISKAIRLKNTVASFHSSLGGALDGLGRFDEAITSLNEALRLDPSSFDALKNMGTALLNAGKLDEALQHLERAVEINPEHPAPYNTIGDVFKAKKESGRATEYYQKAIHLDPSYVQAYNNMGVLLREIGQPDNSIEWYRQALEIDFAGAEVHYNLAISLQELKRPDEALEHLRRAIAINPKYSDAHNNLANLLHLKGELNAAEEHYQQAIIYSRDPALAHANIGTLKRNWGRAPEALAHFREALRLKPDDVDVLTKLGTLLTMNGHFEEALVHLEKAHNLEPDSAKVLNALAIHLHGQGKLSEAVALYDRAISLTADALTADAAGIYSNLILALVYTNVADTELMNRARDFDTRFAVSLLRERAFCNVADPDRRLRIGFVSADFRNHAVSFFCEPLFAHLNRRQFETFAYSNLYIEDAATARLKANADHWRNIFLMDDDAAADLIEADGIDILVDLSSHTGGNRLLVFARKPAPVQVTWLGFSASTGMGAIDYRITDVYAEPPGLTEHLNVETLWRLPRIFCCYQGSENGPTVIDHPPKDDNGYVTFGCFNTYIKLTDPVLALWARIMARLSDARLMLEIAGLETAKFRAEVEARLTGFGLPLDRLILVPRSPANQFVLYNKIDIALDPFPSNGGTTSMDTMWMGVPFVTLAGSRFSSRMGVTILTNAGLPELVAADEDQYVEIAVALATDDARLRSVRHNLRERVEKSPLMDQGLFARDMADAYRGMWKIWCEQHMQKRELALSAADNR